MEKPIVTQTLELLYVSVGEYDKARGTSREITCDHEKKSVTENGEKHRLLHKPWSCVSSQVGEYDKAREHLEKSLAIKKEIGDRKGEADIPVT